MKILIVDDDLGILNSLRIGLASRGFHIQVCNSPYKALNVLATHKGGSRNYELLITDYRMPRMNGLELIHKARKLIPNLMVVLMTAYGDEQLSAELSEIPNCCYMDKPFKPDELITVIEKIKVGNESAR